MTVCTPISTCTKNAVCFIGNVQKQMIVWVSDAIQQSSGYYYTFSKHPRLYYTTTYSSKAKSCLPINGFRAFQGNCFGSCTAKYNTGCHSLSFKGIVSPRRYQKTCINISTGYQHMNLRLLVPKQTQTSNIKCKIGPFSWSVSAGLSIGLLVCFSTSQPSYAEAPGGNESEGCSNKKKVLTGYSVIGIQGDGRCLFRSVAYGACLRLGKPAPNENIQKELADELRARGI